jgi:lipopolysaccharide export LptBFGC system permease protein LptF
MRIISRYLLRAYFPTFLLCLGVFLFVLLMNYFLRLFNLAVMKGISVTWILFCFSRLLPFFISMALPMAFLVALLLTLGQLSESGEVMALRSSGFSFRDILAPFFTLAVLLSMMLFYVNHKASPEGFHSFMNSYSRAVSQVSRLDLQPRMQTRLGDWEFFADSVDGERLSGVRLVKREGVYKRVRVSAPTGVARVVPGSGIRLELENGAMIWPNQDPSTRTDSTFKRYGMFMPFVDYRKVARNPELQELNTLRLRQQIKSGTLKPHRLREIATEAALRSAGAAAPFMLFWVAAPLGLAVERRAKPVSFALSLLVMFVFYGLLAFGIGLGRNDLAWSAWGPWLPSAACLLAGCGLWQRMLKR